MYRKFFKRFFDFICSLLALILLSPVLLVTALLVRIKLGRPVIFKQKRPGLHEEIFTLYKFRTMTNSTDKQGNLLSDEFRLTKFGKSLRSTSLDELPELWNIAKGDLSFVGPRPLLVQYLKLYNERQKIRHNVRPGLTGLVQISGRNQLEWEKKFKLDLIYIKKMSFLFDLKILLITFVKVIKRDGINQTKDVPMDYFKGSNFDEN